LAAQDCFFAHRPQSPILSNVTHPRFLGKPDEAPTPKRVGASSACLTPVPGSYEGLTAPEAAGVTSRAGYLVQRFCEGEGSVWAGGVASAAGYTSSPEVREAVSGSSFAVASTAVSRRIGSLVQTNFPMIPRLEHSDKINKSRTSDARTFLIAE
jgi:hypothetical protein